MKKVSVTLWLLLCVLLPFHAAADVATVSSEAEYNSLVGRIVNLIALRQELAGSAAGAERIGDSGRVLHEVARITNELDVLGVDWTSFLRARGKSGCFPFAKNTFFRPTVQLFNLPRHLRNLAGRPARARDLSPGGEVLDSAFFINRDVSAYSPAEILLIDERNRPRGSITILDEKREGRVEGFLGTDEEGGLYHFVFDPPGMEEQATGAKVIGSTIARLMGYNVPVSTIITVRGTGDPRFDDRRAAATKMVPGPVGSWSYYGFRNRREIRATRILAAWINNNGFVDGTTVISSFRAGNVDLYRYYLGGFNRSLGSAGMRSKMAKDGWEHEFDAGVIVTTPLRWILKPFGLWRERYRRSAKPVNSVVGLLDTNVSTTQYEARYPNMAWRYMTAEDALWAVNLISRFTPEQIGAIVDLAKYSDGEDAEYVLSVLLERQTKIIEHYLGIRVR